MLVDHLFKMTRPSKPKAKHTFNKTPPGGKALTITTGGFELGLEGKFPEPPELVIPPPSPEGGGFEQTGPENFDPTETQQPVRRVMPPLATSGFGGYRLGRFKRTGPLPTDAFGISNEAKVKHFMQKHDEERKRKMDEGKSEMDEEKSKMDEGQRRMDEGKRRM